MNGPDNPLLPLVLRWLREQPAGCSEYELMKRVEADGDHFAALSDDGQLALFQKHFLLMNALYRLQRVLADEEQVWLQISPLHIALGRGSAPSAATAVADGSEHALREYYLDWDNFTGADSVSVAALLNGFWRRFHAVEDRVQALAVLELDAGADWTAIKRQYRRLAAQAHPDRGGDGARFLAVREAYETLRAWRSDPPVVAS